MKNILLLEHDRIVLMDLRFNIKNHHIHDAKTFSRLREQLQRMVFDLLIIDSPEIENIIPIINEVKDKYAIPILIISANTQSEIEDLKAHGCSVIEKPFLLEELRNKIESCFINVPVLKN